MGKFQELLDKVVGDLTGRELAKRIGKSSSYVSQIRDSTIPNDTTICLIAEACNSDRLGDLLFAAARDRLASQDFESALSDLEADPVKRQKRAALLREQALKAFAAPDLGAAEAPPGGVGRTFRDFPEAFYPLEVVTGDKREERGFLIDIADFGAYSASPADTRWIFNLGLAEDVVKHIDKNFLLLDEDRLVERFAKKNLLVIGSPASNHLARMVNDDIVFLQLQPPGRTITTEIERAKGMTKAQRSAYHVDLREQLGPRRRALFAGGICDPTHPPSYVAATYARIAANASSSTSARSTPLLLRPTPSTSGFAGAKRRGNDTSTSPSGGRRPSPGHGPCRPPPGPRLPPGPRPPRRRIFDKHPYGGVLRVELDLNDKFSERTENAKCMWEDEVDDGRKPLVDQKAALLEELAKIAQHLREGRPTGLELSTEQASNARNLIIRLSEQKWEWRPDSRTTLVK